MWKRPVDPAFSLFNIRGKTLLVIQEILLKQFGVKLLE